MIQIDMPMPENCSCCRFAYGDYVEGVLTLSCITPTGRKMYDPDLINRKSRPEWCPLKEQEKPNGKCVNECECWDSAYERGKQDTLKQQEAAIGWKDARYEMPDKPGDYLVFIPGEFHDTIMVARYSFNREIPWRGAQAHSAIEDVLFWMPLPKPPKKEGEQE